MKGVFAMKKIIEVKNLSKTFETKVKNEQGKKEKVLLTAVDNVSFDISQGEIIGFIGPNGAGKSTTIKMLTGILYPSCGDSTVLDYVPWKDRKKMAYEIATVFGQKGSLIPHLPVIDSYKLAGAIYDIKPNDLNARINEIVSFFGIYNLMQRKANTLSLGQRMICEVAIATLHSPKILFLDEPTIGLDIVMKKKVREIIHKLNKEYGMTIFITSHDISDIEKLCSRIILINHGRVMLDSSMKEIKDNYLSKYIAIATFEKELDLKATENTFKNTNISFEIDNDTITLEFDKKDISTGEILSLLSSLGSISDFNVTGSSLENVIYDIYTAKKEEEK